MESVNILGTQCDLEFAEYHNGTICIMANLKGKGEEYTRLTINWEDYWEGTTPYEKTFKFPTVIIDSRNQNEGMYECLKKAGVIELNYGAYLSGTNGQVRVARLSKKWIKEAK